MSRRMRVYVAGPISKGSLAENIRVGTEAGIRLVKAGFAPLVPQLTCYMGGPTPAVLPSGTTYADWMAATLPWVAVSDAVLRLPGESTGADLEIALAKRRGIPVYTSLDVLLTVSPTVKE